MQIPTIYGENIPLFSLILPKPSVMEKMIEIFSVVSYKEKKKKNLCRASNQSNMSFGFMYAGQTETAYFEDNSCLSEPIVL